MLIYIGEISDAYYYGVYNIIKMLFPKSIITRDKKEKAEITFEFEIFENEVFVYINNEKISKAISRGDISLTLKQCIYNHFGISLPFGVFTGIRPAKVIIGYGDNGEAFENEFYANHKKVEIANKCAKAELKLLKTINKGSLALYIHIPFCPTRCTYCSFTAAAYSEKLIEEYFDALYLELREIIKTIKENNLNVISVYVGGGTPTVLSEKKLMLILGEIKNNFPDISEFTVEAGRPDTITEGKLSILKESGVTRISINPQSLNNETLKRIGRHHTADDFFKAYEKAEKFNFKSINTDLIAGLYGESISDYKYTLSTILKLRPQSLTVHTLCHKRCADDKEYLINSDTEKMLEYTYDKISGIYEPYYIYRQKNAMYSLENTGFVKNEDICAYNIIMMEEIASVVAVGAGSASKLIDFKTKKPFSKLRSDKQPQRYISTIEEIIKEKRSFLENGKERL